MFQIVEATFLPTMVKFGQVIAKIKRVPFFMTHSVDRAVQRLLLSLSTVQSAFYEPTEKTGRVENADSQSTELFEPTPRPTLRQELAAGRNQERTAVVIDRGGSAT